MTNKPTKTNKGKGGRPSKEKQASTKKDLFENWFGWGYSDSFIIQHSKYGRDAVVRNRKLWEDQITLETDFAERQETARNNTIVTLDRIIHELKSNLDTFKGDTTITTKNGDEIPNLGVMNLVHTYYDKIAKWYLLKCQVSKRIESLS